MTITKTPSFLTLSREIRNEAYYYRFNEGIVCGAISIGDSLHERSQTPAINTCRYDRPQHALNTFYLIINPDINYGFDAPIPQAQRPSVSMRPTAFRQRDPHRPES